MISLDNEMHMSIVDVIQIRENKKINNLVLCQHSQFNFFFLFDVNQRFKMEQKKMFGVSYKD